MVQTRVVGSSLTVWPNLTECHHYFVHQFKCNAFVVACNNSRTNQQCWNVNTLLSDLYVSKQPAAIPVVRWSNLRLKIGADDSDSQWQPKCSGWRRSGQTTHALHTVFQSNPAKPANACPLCFFWSFNSHAGDQPLIGHAQQNHTTHP